MGDRRQKGRFIPAGAGNTANDDPGDLSYTVHPRRRGEHLTMSCPQNVTRGSSPQARGTRHQVFEDFVYERFIPAGAGNTVLTSTGCDPGSVHPRRRGEHLGAHLARVDLVGSSPQARGTHRARFLAAAQKRFIPAGAGNTPRCPHGAGWRPVHPRRRGEHIVALHITADNVRFIPAGAGNTACLSPRPRTWTVHPRRRGEHVQQYDKAWARWRFIPAGAGNTPRARQPRARQPVHPRRRGEHRITLPACILRFGSSPQARGTLQQWTPSDDKSRFIPAGAGNTQISRTNYS